jgi:hypothetical protein
MKILVMYVSGRAIRLGVENLPFAEFRDSYSKTIPPFNYAFTADSKGYTTM